MKASELIEHLQTEVSKHGDLNIRLVCDHGQVLMSATGCSAGYIEDESEYMGEEIHPDDVEDSGAVKVIVVEGL